MYHSSSQKRHWTFAGEEQLARLRADANRKFKCRAVANGKVRSRTPAPTPAAAGTCGLSWSPRLPAGGRARSAKSAPGWSLTDAGPRLAVTEGRLTSWEMATIKPWGMSSLCRTRTGHFSCRMSGQTILSSWQEGQRMVRQTQPLVPSGKLIAGRIVVVVGKTVPVLQWLKNVAKELVNGSIRLKLMPKLKGVFPGLEMGKWLVGFAFHKQPSRTRLHQERK